MGGGGEIVKRSTHVQFLSSIASFFCGYHTTHSQSRALPLVGLMPYFKRDRATVAHSAWDHERSKRPRHQHHSQP
jgi:hypothetical protein